MFATVQGMNGFTSTDTSQITITLIGEHKTVGPQALDGSSHSGSTPMGSLLPVDIQIVIGKDGTTHRRNTHGFLLHAHFLDDLSHEFMYHTMRTTGAVVHVVVVHQCRFLIYQILWCYNIVFHLTSSSLKLPQSPRAQEQYRPSDQTAQQAGHR